MLLVASNLRAPSAARSNHPSHVGSSVTPSVPTLLGRNLGSINRDSCAPIGNKARVKKYGCGSASGDNHAATALRAASGLLLAATSARNSGATAFRNGAGTNHAIRISLAVRGVSAKVA